MITPSHPQSASYPFAWVSSYLDPFHHRSGDSIKSQINCIASIIVLGLAVCPATIARVIIPFIVDPVKRITTHLCGRSPTHIFKKCLERIAPSIADRNASAAIKSICCSVLIVATTLHSGPRSIFNRTSVAVGGFWHTNILRKNMTVLKKHGELIRYQRFGATLATC